MTITVNTYCLLPYSPMKISGEEPLVRTDLVMFTPESILGDPNDSSKSYLCPSPVLLRLSPLS